MNSFYPKPVVSTKKIIVISIAAITILIAAIAYFSFRKSDNGILSKIPDKVKSVLVIDLGSISQKLFINDFGKDKKSSLELLKEIPDSLKDIDFTESGISLLGKLALFTLEDTISNEVSLHFVVKIDEAKIFDNFIADLCHKFNSNIEKEDHFNIAYSDTFALLLAWDNNYVVGTKTSSKTTSAVNQLRQILLTEKDHSLIEIPEFASSLKHNCDLLFYSKAYKKAPSKYIEVFNNEMNHIASFINFNNGEIDVETLISVDSGGVFDKLFAKSNGEFYRLNDMDTCLAGLSFNVDPESLKQLQSSVTDILINDKRFPLLKSWNGELNMIFMGTEIIESEFTGYDYDDDFNKIEVKQIKKDKIPDIRALVGVHPKIFDSILKTNRPVRENKDTLLFPGSNYLLRNLDGQFLIYCRQKTMPEFSRKKVDENIFLYLDYSKFTNWYKESGIELLKGWNSDLSISRITLTASKSKEIEINGKIDYTDKSKNSLFSLLEDIQK